MKKKAIAFSAKLTTTFLFSTSISVLRIYIFDDNGFPLNYTAISQSEAQTGYAGVYLAKLDLSFTPEGTATQTAYFKNSSGTNLFQCSYVQTNGAKELYIACESDNEALDYLGSRRLKMGVEYEFWVNNPGNGPFGGVINLQFMLTDNALSFDATNDVFT